MIKSLIVLIVGFILPLLMYSYTYDLIVIGGGAAGMAAAQEAAKINKHVAIIEKYRLGGSKIWTGDVPFKTLIQIAAVAHKINTLSSLGIRHEQDFKLDYSRVMLYITSVIKIISSWNSPTEYKKKNIDVYFGDSIFIDPHTINVNGETLRADSFIIATGSKPHIPYVEGLSSVNYLIPENFFEQEVLPKSIIILGGGPLGSELAPALQRLGVEVTLLMKHGTLLPTFDFEMVELKMHLMREEGVNLQCNMKAHKVYEKDGVITVECYDHHNQKHLFTAEKLFLALGRDPNLGGLNLENIGVEANDKGVIVDSYMRTTVPHIFACGDVTAASKTLLSRVAYYQAKLSVNNLFASYWFKQKAAYKEVTKLIYTSHPLATKGLSEQDARKAYGKSIKIYRYDYNYAEKPLIDNAIVGRVKLIFDNYGLLIGIHILGEHAGELVDMLKLGQRLDDQLESRLSDLSISPSYCDIFGKILLKYEKEFPRPQLWFNFLFSLLNTTKKYGSLLYE